MSGRGVDVGVGGSDVGAARGRDPETDDRSLGDLVGELTREFGQLVRQEMQLAKTELKEEAVKAGRAAGQLTAAAVAAHLCALLAALAVAWAIGEAIPVWTGLAIVAAVLGVVALVLYSRGRGEIQQIRPLPEESPTPCANTIGSARPLTTDERKASSSSDTISHDRQTSDPSTACPLSSALHASDQRHSLAFRRRYESSAVNVQVLT